MEPCGRCGRTLLEVRRDLGVDALRGAAPLCPVPACPLVRRVTGLATVEARGRELAGPTPPAIFVGRHGYPRVAVGPLFAPPAVDASGPDPAGRAEPESWRGLGIADVLAMRARLVRGRRLVDVQRPARDAVLDVAREIALAERPVETEVTLAKDLRVALRPALDGTAAPMGPGVEVLDARVTEHVPVPRRVDAAVSDTHARAGDTMLEMYRGGVPVSHVQRLLSVGLLGEATRRRLVPTRWSITATDDTLGRAVAERVRHLQQLGEPRVHFAELHGNRFFVLLVPDAWSFEMQEAWEVTEGGVRRVETMVDAEGHRGRTAYAENITGAYYAARLAVLEHLEREQRQAAALVVREITDAYWAPLGVWVIREGVRDALAAKGLPFGDVASAWRHVLRRARFPEAFPRAALVEAKLRQRRLEDFGPG